MKILILNHDEVVELLPMKECIALMREALIKLASGEVHQPLRTIVRPPDASGVMGLMPSYVGGDEAAYGLKTVCIFPSNPAKGKDAHQGAVLLFSAETGELLALMNASAITAIRTAAVSAVATDLLAREDACDLAIIGAGVQARTHLKAIAEVRLIKRCRVTSKNIEHARRIANEMSGSVQFAIEVVESVERAVDGADVIATVTNSKKPVLQREWISPGVHLNVVGSSTPHAREIDTATIAASALFVDRRESTLNESGDYLAAMHEGAIGPEHIRAELGEVLTGQKPGRTSPDEITLFKSLGLAVEDLAAANYLYRKAARLNAGVWVKFA
jgi:ornithine cyclodeaminase/alanine dehydrogenase-like protein (mu-crystallin family)